jgi:hypothetical protein
MEWLTGLALLPVLVCGVMMGGMALAGVIGLRRTRDHTTGDAPERTREAERPPQDAVR